MRKPYLCFSEDHELYSLFANQKLERAMRREATRKHIRRKPGRLDEDTANVQTDRTLLKNRGM